MKMMTTAAAAAAADGDDGNGDDDHDGDDGTLLRPPDQYQPQTIPQHFVTRHPTTDLSFCL